MKHNFFLKTFRIFATLAILIQSLSPAALVSTKPVFASENSDSSQVEPVSDQNNSSPSDSNNPTVELVEPSSPPTESSTETSNIISPQNDAQNSPADTETENDLTLSIPNNSLASALNQNLDSPVQTESATVSTDKPDYSPTDTVIISGSNFNPLSQYTVYITSTDPPSVNFSSSVETNPDGEFTFLFPLDGIYRPNYKIEVKDLSGKIISSTTFTDGTPVISVTIAGTGTGTITSTDGFINCSSGTCTHAYGGNFSTTLSAVVGGSSTFAGWTGGCTGTSSTCAAGATGNNTFSVTATFNLSDTTAPTGQIAINSNATYTTTSNVTLNFSSVSADVTQIRLRNGTVGDFQTAISYENPHSYTLPNNGDGTYTVSVRFIDSSGNQSSGVISDSIILDTTFPSSTINSVVDGNSNTVSSGGLTKSNSASINFNASDTNGIAGSECKIDSGLYSSCTSPKSYSGLSDGSHTVSVRSTDSAGNVESTATFSWSVDATVPILNSKSTYSGWYNADQTSTFTYSDGTGSGIVSGTPVTCTISTEGSNQTCSVTPNVCDAAGNCNTAPVTSNSADIDTAAPDAPSANPAAGNYTSDQSVTLSSSDATSGLAAIYYTTDGSSPDNTKTLYSGPITVDKDMTIKAIAYDNAGNTSAILTADYGIAPIISAESSSAVSSSGTTITWTTDDPATSRVIYDTVSHGDSTASPNYGYANSTTEADAAPKVTSHSVSISGLTAATIYYFRTVSHGSPEAVSSEKSFTTSSSSDSTGSVAGTSTSTSNSSAAVCSESKPGSAPSLLSTTPGQNSVTLIWSKASNPVTYYLVTYGLSAGAQTYGNPNVGDSNTISYTVSNLSGGTPYFFKVRAGNGCAPGDFSNELSAIPFGGTFPTGQIAPGFEEGVLGTASKSAEVSTPSAVLGSQNEKPAEKPASKTTNELLKNWWIIVLIVISLLILFFLLRRRRRKETEIK